MKNSFFKENPWSNLLILINNFILCTTTLFKIEKTYSSLFFLNALRETIPLHVHWDILETVGLMSGKFFFSYCRFEWTVNIETGKFLFNFFF